MEYQPHSYVREPLWRAAHTALRRAVPPELATWLFDTASLTGRLRRLCPGTFSVRVLDQRWQRPMRNESRLLGMGNREYGLVRQVHLLCGRRPLVFARTVLPAATLRGAPRLARLGNRPLGAALFADKSMTRDGIEISRITPRHPVFAAALGIDHLPGTPQAIAAIGTIWGRRSVFRIGGRPLLVSEIFLPALVPASRGARGAA